MRKNATDCERILWRRLRNRKFANYKFRRQHSMDRYTLDFDCPEAQLPLNLTVADTNPCDTKYTIESELKFWRAKKSWCYDFGIIKYARNSTAFFKQFGLRWRNAVHTIPHLNPLPLRKGEATVRALSQKSSGSFFGSSMHSFTLIKNVTASFPSTAR